MDFTPEYTAVIDSVQSDVNDLYQTKFSVHFAMMDELYDRLKSRSRPITDQELEDILTLLPLELFAVSEELNKLRVALETIKLKNKETKENELNDIAHSMSDSDWTPSQIKEYISRMLPIRMIPYELAVQVYTCVIELVSSRIQFAKELIMSAKKIWDGRRATEKSMPVSEGTIREDNLPRYSVPGTYIKGSL